VSQTVSKSTPTTASPASAVKGSNLPAMLGWFDSQRLEAIARAAVHSVRDEARALLRVSRIEQPEAALLSPEQSFFLRENLKLRLLNARLGLLSRQTDTARADLATAAVWLGKYFDQNSRKTQAASQLLQQIQSQLKTSELPRLDETMAALSTAAAGR
jgi:uroporphyrin-III C-methyltransferase